MFKPEITVTLHFNAEDYVTTSYPMHRFDEAVTLYREYMVKLKDGQKVSMETVGNTVKVE